MTDALDDDDSLDLKPVNTPTVRKVPARPVMAAVQGDGPVSDPLVERLRREHDSVQAGGMTAVAGGAAIIVVASFILGLAIAGMCELWFDSSVLGIIGWTIVLILLFGIPIGLLLRPTAPSDDAGRYVAGAPPELLANGPLDWPLLGPRMIVNGVRLAQGETVARGYFYDRCALLLRQLGKRGEQMPLTSLLISDDETPLMLGKVVAYLDKNGWLGTSSDKTRVWLSTKARNVLMEMGVVPDTDITRGQ